MRIFMKLGRRIHERAESSEHAHQTTKLTCFCDDSSERLWLAIAFIKSMELCVVGYNEQHCKNAKRNDGTNKP